MYLILYTPTFDLLEWILLCQKHNFFFLINFDDQIRKHSMIYKKIMFTTQLVCNVEGGLYLCVSSFNGIMGHEFLFPNATMTKIYIDLLSV